MDTTALEGLEKIVALMKREGVLKLKAGEVEVELSPEALIPQKTSAAAVKPGVEVGSEGSEPTDEQLLYWSSNFEPTKPKSTPSPDTPEPPIAEQSM